MTNVPLPCFVEIKPSRLSSWVARRTVMDETANSSTSRIERRDAISDGPRSLCNAFAHGVRDLPVQRAGRVDEVVFHGDTLSPSQPARMG